MATAVGIDSQGTKWFGTWELQVKLSAPPTERPREALADGNGFPTSTWNPGKARALGLEDARPGPNLPFISGLAWMCEVDVTQTVPRTL